MVCASPTCSRTKSLKSKSCLSISFAPTVGPGDESVTVLAFASPDLPLGFGTAFRSAARACSSSSLADGSSSSSSAKFALRLFLSLSVSANGRFVGNGEVVDLPDPSANNESRSSSSYNVRTKENGKATCVGADAVSRLLWCPTALRGWRCLCFMFGNSTICERAVSRLLMIYNACIGFLLDSSLLWSFHFNVC